MIHLYRSVYWFIQLFCDDLQILLCSIITLELEPEMATVCISAKSAVIP